MRTWHLTVQFLFFTDRDTLLPLLLFSLLWNTAALSPCFPGQGVFTSVQLCQRRAVTHWWGADGFSTALPLQGTPSAHRRTPEDCAGASMIECPLAPAQMLVQENMEGPAGVGLYGVPGASSQGDTGEAEVWLRYRAQVQSCLVQKLWEKAAPHLAPGRMSRKATGSLKGGARAEVSAGAPCSSNGCRTLAAWAALWFRHCHRSALLCTPRELCQAIDLSGATEPRPQLIRT